MGTFAAEKRLQWEGKFGASGKAVFSGMLAAPSKYPFGTKIYLEWVWVGSVEDRGGAIVKAGQRGYSHDRIDIWMGYGDEGRIRANKWGKRTIRWVVVTNDQDIDIKFQKSILDGYDGLKVSPDSSIKDIQQLQELFEKLDLYQGKITGNYEDIKNTLIEFQVDNKAIETKNDTYAGYYGPKTQLALIQKFGNTDPFQSEKKSRFKEFVWEISEEEDIILHEGDFTAGPESNADEVKQLQELFKKLKLYEWEITGDFEDIKEEIIDFQIEQNVISSARSFEAGYYGPKTQSALFSYFLDKRNDKPWDKITTLSSSEKKKVEKVADAVHKYIKKEYRNDPQKQERVLNNFKEKVEKLAQKKKWTTKQRFEYLAEIL